MPDTSSTIVPVILSGGSGTRLWPLSRTLFPKQLQPLTSGDSLLVETARRTGGSGYAPPVIVCNEDHRFIVAEQLRASGIEPGAILLEPEGKNTAPATALAAVWSQQTHGQDALLLVLPSDHRINDEAAFKKAVDAALAAVAAGKLATFGITPSHAATGYGYIKAGRSVAGADGCFKVDDFVEKPDQATAEGYLKASGYFWNSGIFFMPAARYLDELAVNHPEISDRCQAAVTNAEGDLDFIRIAADAFSGMETISIDYAVMEHTGDAIVVPVDMGWNDIGSWQALWDISNKDGDGNVILGDVLVQNVTGSYIRSDRQLIGLAGLTDMVVVATDDAVLVTPRASSEDVKQLAEELKHSQRSEHASHTRVYRPWGWYQELDRGAGFQVKLINISPGAKISLQRHQRRAEHWVVVAGEATVTRGEERLKLQANQSTYIPIGMVHRLENAAAEPLQIIEVQSGDYLGEDDIERFDDQYGRT